MAKAIQEKDKIVKSISGDKQIKDLTNEYGIQMQSDRIESWLLFNFCFLATEVAVNIFVIIEFNESFDMF